MKLSNQGKLRLAARMAFLAGGFSLTSATALAQEAAPATTETTTEAGAVDLDTVTVTGTRIKSQTLTATSPVIEISGDEFQYTGATLVEDLINQYPMLSPVFDNFQNNPSLGYSEVDLRGLGAQRTLTLVNGRRIPKGVGETPDISIIPAALIKRVDVLTGGASAVYGSDAIAGVVNFILDDHFEGVSVSGSASAYQHDNDNDYIQGLMDARGYDYPTGDSGFDGQSRSVDLVIGSSFGEAGHATAWATWRKNKPLFQGERDYSSCALSVRSRNASDGSYLRGEPYCGGSATADPANFYIVGFDPAGGYSFYGYAAPNSSGTWQNYGGSAPYIYNYAPINYYQRPDTRYTAGFSIDYEISEYAKPYLESMFVNRQSSVQIAESGTFFTPVVVGCDFDPINNLCSDLAIPDDNDLLIYVAKRNVEGGPRIQNAESTNFSITPGIAGKIWGSWTYDASLMYSRGHTAQQGYNDFLTTKIEAALLDNSYPVWDDSITPEQAAALAGVSLQNWVTEMKVFSAYATGDLGFGLPTAGGEPISMVAGVEKRIESYSYVADSNSAEGNFAGAGGTSPAIDAGYDVKDVYFEANAPLLADMGALSHLDVKLGYRYSDYSTSGGADTYKAEFGASFFDDKYKLRGGYNRAIRGASINELYSSQQLGLWSGTDPCAGSAPEYTAEQCALTGVDPSQYGRVPANSAGQYNGLFVGNPDLDPETADTWTIGAAATPIKNLSLSVDYFDIKIKDQISTLDPEIILRLCAVGGQEDMCSLIHRNPTSGDLYRGTTGYVDQIISNSGEVQIRGIDVTGSYVWNLGDYGRLTSSYVGSYVLEKEYAPVSGDSESTFDCAGVVSPECQTPKFRHIASTRYSIDRYSVGLRWRYMGKLDYESPYDGSALTTDRLNCAPKDSPEGEYPCQGTGKIGSYSYFDLSGSVEVGPAVWTAGVNNMFDREPPLVGPSLVLNGNSIGGYDQAGRYLFTNLELKF